MSRVPAVPAPTGTHSWFGDGGVNRRCTRPVGCKDPGMTARATAALALATALAGAGALLSGILATPIAHADPLDAIRSAVNGARSGSPCPALTYNGDLEYEAQLVANDQGSTTAPRYEGNFSRFWGTGDPQSEAINSAMSRARPKISDCKYKDLGVGFVRHEESEIDVVAIVLGEPAAPAPAAVPEPAEVDDPAVPAAVAPHDAVQVDIERAGFNVEVTVTNNADLAGKCTYVATPVGVSLLPDVNRNFNIGANASEQLTFLAPPPLSTYQVVGVVPRYLQRPDYRVRARRAACVRIMAELALAQVGLSCLLAPERISTQYLANVCSSLGHRRSLGFGHGPGQFGLSGHSTSG